MRPPETIMRLRRLGSFHASRLSFMRILLRRLANDEWRFERMDWQIDEKGVGHALYCAHGPERSYTLVAFSHDLAPEKRSDRVIAEEWDATFTLFDGVPDEADIERLHANVPLQEGGRLRASELCLARANRSVRLFNHCVEALASGHQPDMDELKKVGYLMRTTAVYGSGKFGLADRAVYADQDELAAPFQAEMLTVFLIREFSFDIVEHLAAAKAGASQKAVRMSAEIRKNLGIGNSTGLGMAPFLINHPVLVNNWILARETAIMRVRSVQKPSATQQLVFLDRLLRAQQSVQLWRSEHPDQKKRIDGLKTDFEKLRAHIDQFEAPPLLFDYPFDRLMEWAPNELGLEAQEALASLILEPFGDLVDDLCQTMSAPENERFTIDGAMSLSKLRKMIEQNFSFALETDFDAQDAQHFVWYTSQTKLEPRLGLRKQENLEAYEQPLGLARDVARLYQALGNNGKSNDDNRLVAPFLLEYPEHRHVVRRVQMAAHFPYGEIHDNTLDRSMLAIDLLRLKLSFFGATHFDPRSDRWVRIAMYRGAPLADELMQTKGSKFEDDWLYPPLARD